MSHRNPNTFTSFNEQINLKEQKECSEKGPSGNNFCREKKLSQSSSIQTCTLPLQFSTPLSPSSTLSQSSTTNKMSSASSPKSPQVTLPHFPSQPQYSFTDRNSSSLQPLQSHKPAAHLPTHKTSSLTMGCNLLSAFHPSPGSAPHPWWTDLIAVRTAGYLHTPTDKTQPHHTVWALPNTPAGH